MLQARRWLVMGLDCIEWLAVSTSIFRSTTFMNHEEHRQPVDERPIQEESSVELNCTKMYTVPILQLPSLVPIPTPIPVAVPAYALTALAGCCIPSMKHSAVLRFRGKASPKRTIFPSFHVDRIERKSHVPGVSLMKISYNLSTTISPPLNPRHAVTSNLAVAFALAFAFGLALLTPPHRVPPPVTDTHRHGDLDQLIPFFVIVFFFLVLKFRILPF